MRIFGYSAFAILQAPGASDSGDGFGTGLLGLIAGSSLLSQGVLLSLLLLSIGQTYDEDADIYEITRFAWRLSVENARGRLVLAHSDGVVVGAFRPQRWLEATSRNFPGKGDDPDRWGFVGLEASDVWHDYVGKRVPDRYRPRGAANPVRYCDPE